MWLTCNFSLDYLVYNVQQNGYESCYLDLRTNSYNKCTRKFKATRGRISKQILGVKDEYKITSFYNPVYDQKEKKQNIVTYQPHSATLTYSDYWKLHLQS